MSDCRLPRNIVENNTAPVSLTITITGNYYSSSYGYVTVNSTKYTANQTFNYTVPPDSYPEIVVYCSAQGTSYQSNCQITLNGAVVKSGAGSYTFTANKSYTIVLTRTGSTSSNRYWTAAITG